MERLFGSVAHVVLVDNAPVGYPGIDRWRSLDRVHVIQNHNRGGLAGAYNAAVSHLIQDHSGITHVVLVDDDSDPSVLDELLADPKLRLVLNDTSTAAVAPAHRDRATGMRARHIQLNRWKIRYLDREVRGLQQVSFIINSMSVWRLEAIAIIGAFDEALAVDYVDTEYCLRARFHGLGIYLAADREFSHSIGERRVYKVFGRTMQSGGHGPDRRRSLGRNTTQLGMRYASRLPAFALLTIARLVTETLGIVLVEDQKLAKLSALWRGVFDALLVRNSAAGQLRD